MATTWPRGGLGVALGEVRDAILPVPPKTAKSRPQPPKSSIESHLRFAESFRVHGPTSTSEFAAVSTLPPRNNSLCYSPPRAPTALPPRHPGTTPVCTRCGYQNPLCLQGSATLFRVPPTFCCVRGILSLTPRFSEVPGGAAPSLTVSTVSRPERLARAHKTLGYRRHHKRRAFLPP